MIFQFNIDMLVYSDFVINGRVPLIMGAVLGSTTARRRPARVGVPTDVNSRQLRAAVAVAEYRSFIAAAADLGISQPALTLSIKRLEETLGVALFLRNTRQVTLTAAGREFVAMAERVLKDLRLGIQGVQELTDRRRGQVIVTSLIPVRMSDVVAEYSRRFPGIDIELREGFADDVKEDVRGGIADFGIGYLDDLPASHASEPLLAETLCVLLRSDHPLARRRHVEFRALRDVGLVSLPARSRARRQIDAAATAAGFALRHVVTVGLPVTLLSLVRSGVGAAVIPSGPPPWRAFENLVSRPLVRPTLTSEIGVIRLRDRDLSPAAAGLLALARERLHTGRSRRR
jgi:LysR family transcriptional regulator, carnitine catabolism transcriptional activator